uniref:Opsin-5 n=2 Tax=Pseudonaja textilis TaxID=8673 RepID=A0A670Y2N7_PSETE
MWNQSFFLLLRTLSITLTFFYFFDISFNMTGMYSRQNTSSQDINLPHNQPDGDPFASKLSKEADIIAGIYLLLIGVLSTLGNGYVIYMSIQRKRKLKPAEIMTVNLAVCDLGISVAGKPFSIIAFLSHRWIFGWSGCRWYGWTGFFFGVGSLITMTAVSLDRYFKICYLAYGIWLKRHHAFICLGIIWSYAAFWATIPFAGLGNYAPEPFGTSCTLDWWLAQDSVAGQAFILNILFFCLVFPTVVIVFSYIKIIAKVKSSSKDVAHYDNRIQNSHDLEIKLTKVAMLICAGFLFAWIPYAVVSVWSAFGKPDSVPIKVSVVPTLLAKSAAMYNPVIYQVINCKSACCQRGALRPLRKKNSLKKSRLYVVSTEKSEEMTETQLDIA